ncbi:S8 family peptidase [Gimesia maris]|uniref:S8 family peptidase n=1 Tax=Gimesia maris TaxID=122 RepID=UPI0032F0249C
MPPNHQFEYLPLILREHGPARFPQSVRQEDAITAANRNNRSSHTGNLQTSVTSASERWKTNQKDRAAHGLPSIESGIPLLLKIDTSLEIDDLRKYFEFEIVSEQEDGYVIVASEDVDLTIFQNKVSDFVGGIRGSSSVAKIHEVREDLTQQERLNLILTDSLIELWPTINDDSSYIVDVSVTCIGNWVVPPKPKRNPRWKDETWARKENTWSNERLEAYEKWDNLKDERMLGIHQIIDHYEAEILSNYDNTDEEALELPDSFTLRVEISGKGLKDLVFSYPYIFEVAEPDDIETPQQIERELKEISAQLDIQPPDTSAPTVCIIDSGIQENHIWLEPAIDDVSSRCFLPNVPTNEVADFVRPSGHGTRVAGAVLYGETVPKSGIVNLDTWIQNARVLDNNCGMPEKMLPAAVFNKIVKQYHLGKRQTRIFNHSINADAPCRNRHMSTWATTIDMLCNNYDVLVIQSSGNLRKTREAPRLGVSEHIANGRNYPDYLNENACRVANPAQSFQALTVGSIAYGAIEIEGWRSMAPETGHPSAFSRCGLGIWGAIKPEVVEYGGDFLFTESDPPDVDTPSVGRDVYPELIRSTMYGGPAFDSDEVGTSYAAPKVTRIAARLQSLLPEESCLLYRALIVQSARWPDWTSQLSRENQTEILRRLGYGIPDMARATSNTEYRTTFITHKERVLGPSDCHIYQVPIPSELRRPGDDYDIRIDVTLSYAASPRRTRRSPRGYLATWLDWISNRRGESIEAFLTRALKSDDDPSQEGAGTIGWTIESRSNWGQLPDVRRNVGTIQKDWAVVKSNALPDDFCIAVRGHQGWSRDPDTVASYTLAVSFEILGQEIPIYEPLLTAVVELESQVESETEVEVEIEG